MYFSLDGLSQHLVASS